MKGLHISVMLAPPFVAGVDARFFCNGHPKGGQMAPNYPENIEFWRRCWPPKSTNVAPKSDVERSLFRDAVETVGKSSETIGKHGFEPSKWLCI